MQHNHRWTPITDTNCLEGGVATAVTPSLNSDPEYPVPKDSIGLISYGLAVPHGQTLADLKEHAPLFGYEARMASDILQVRDPNGHWLELEFTPPNGEVYPPR
jgi:hypothetical protein